MRATSDFVGVHLRNYSFNDDLLILLFFCHVSGIGSSRGVTFAGFNLVVGVEGIMDDESPVIWASSHLQRLITGFVSFF